MACPACAAGSSAIPTTASNSRPRARLKRAHAHAIVYRSRRTRELLPAADDDRPTGSPALTTYLLAVTDEAAKEDRRFALPADLRDQLAAGLANFVDGKIERKFWAPRNDLDFEKLAAIKALSRYGLAQPRMLGSITVAPDHGRPPPCSITTRSSRASTAFRIAKKSARRPSR